VTITGTSGTLVHSATATFTFGAAPDFAIAAGAVSPAQILAGASGTSTITLTAINGFTGTVTLSVSASTPAGLTCTLPASVTFGTSPQTVTLSCSAAVAGDYTVTVTGTSGTLSHTTTPATLFHVVDFTIAASAVSPAQILVGASGTSTITVTGLNGFTGTVTLSSVSTPTSLTCSLPASVTFGTSPQTATLSCSANAAGDYTATVTGVSGTLNHSTGSIMFHVVDFTISASSPAAVNAGASATSTITITAVNGFSGVVTLTDTVPTGLACGAIIPGTVTGSGTATVSCSSTSAGTFTLAITGTSGTLTHSATATFNFNDFTISPSTAVEVDCSLTGPSSIPLCPGSTLIAASSINGFTGSVTLTIVSPSAGLTATLGKTTLNLATGFDSTTLTLSATAVGTYTVTITGTSGTLSHTTAIITLVVTTPDFVITASPSFIQNVAQNGGTAQSTINVTPTGGFNGVVSFASPTINATGLTASLSATSVTMSGSVTLTVTGQTQGAYLVTITGTSGTITRSTTVTVTVTGIQVSPPAFTQTNWKQRLQLSKVGNTQTWRFGIVNTDNATTIYVQVQINVVDGAGTAPFTLTSATFTLTPTQVLNNQFLTQTFDPNTDVGKSFTFQMTIFWGTSPTSMTQQSTDVLGGAASGIRTSGSFTVLP
jgi:hypothetical protein